MRIIVTGGGTGGHLFPGIAVAKGIQKKYPDCKVMFIGTNRHIDKKALKSFDFQLEHIKCMGIKGKSILNKLQSILQLPTAVVSALKLIKLFQPNIVLGVGGYVTGPVLLAAKIKRIPVCIHEQNSIPGLANKIASKIADKIFISIPCDYNFTPKKTFFTGNPVREEIIMASSCQYMPKNSNDKKHILVLGGSQGAHAINSLMQEIASHLKSSLGNRLHITHQTGVKDMEEVKKAYRNLNIQATVQAFFSDMSLVYKNIDIVVSRAGATTLAELSVMGIPAILIPFPYAADNHQVLNANYYVKNGSAIMIEEKDLDSSLLANEISSLLQNQKDLRRMAGNMKKLAKPEATTNIIDQCTLLTNKL